MSNENKNDSEFPLEQSSNEAETVCRDCTFAVYEGETQTACALGNLDKLEKQGADIIEVYDETNKEFYVVKGRVCVAWRGSDWREKHKDRTDLEKIVARETMIRMDANIYMDKDTTLADVETTILSLKDNLIKPAQITLLNNFSKIDRPTMARICTHSGFKWRVENIQEGDVDKLRCIDIAIRKLNANELNYYCVFDAGRKIPVNFISDINNSLNKDMNRFLALRGEDGNGDVGQILIHKRIGGNRDKSFLDKIEHTTRSQGCPNLLQKTSEIVSG